MQKAILFLGGLAVVGAVLFFLLVGTKSAHLELDGKILKVRVVAVSPEASLAIVDFRVTNPSDVPFVVETVEMTSDPASGERIAGRVVSKPQMDSVFQALKIVGPKYNDILGMQDHVEPHKTIDRMEAARFEVPASVLESRKSLRLKFEEIDGTTAEFSEEKK